MKSVPMVFQGKMVQALLDDRMSVTRRPISIEDITKLKSAAVTLGVKSITDPSAQSCLSGFAPCQVGDHIWVRETWGVVSHCTDENGVHSSWVPNRDAQPISELKYGSGYYSGHVIYRSDGEFIWENDIGDAVSAWHSPISMNKSVSRITLRVKSVRIQRLKDITDEDAIAEGMPTEAEAKAMAVDAGLSWYDKPKKWFKRMWINSYGDKSWNLDDYVWVFDFEAVKSNVLTVVNQNSKN
ncbi:hypothetical protein A8V38_13805 [Vibrio parahaemolyticus]|nr:hypothetical protein [Vibrio parahaemolyticus]